MANFWINIVLLYSEVSRFRAGFYICFVIKLNMPLMARGAYYCDYYEKLNDSCALEILSIQYYFQDDNNNKDYFEANYFLLNKLSMIFVLSNIKMSLT